jgi:hypothetical protein
MNHWVVFSFDMRGADEEAPLCWLDPETALIFGLEVVLLL